MYKKIFIKTILASFYITLFHSNNLAAEVLKEFSTANLILSNQVSYDLKIRDIEKSKKSIDLATYTIENDVSTSKLLSELIKKAKSGVKVRVLLDLFMNFSNIDILKEALLAAGPNLEIKFIIRDRLDNDFGLLIFNECLLQNSKSENTDQSKLNLCGNQYQAFLITSKVILYKYFGINFFKIRNQELIESAIMAKDLAYIFSVVNIEKTNGVSTYREGILPKIDAWLLAVIFSSSYINEVKNPIERMLTRILINPISLTVKSMSAGFHVKSLNIDGEKAYFGGRNIGDPYSIDDFSQRNSKKKFHIFSDVEARVIFKKNDPFIDKYFEEFWLKGSNLAEVYKKYSFDKYRTYKLDNLNCEEFSLLIQNYCKTAMKSKIETDYYTFLKQQRLINLNTKEKKIYKRAVIAEDIFKIPSSKMRYIASQPSNSVRTSKIGDVLLNVINKSCNLSIISPYLFPPFEIRTAIINRLNSKKCSTQIITSTMFASDFSIIGFLGAALVKPIEDYTKVIGSTSLITYWDGPKYLHHKIFSTESDLFLTSANLDTRSFYLDTNNLIQFELQPANASFTRLLKKNIYKISDFHEKDIENELNTKLIDKILSDLDIKMDRAASYQFRRLLDKLFLHIYHESELNTKIYPHNSSIDSDFNFL